MKLEISLNDKRYFDLSIGDRVLQSDVFNSTGHIPIFSANVFEPFGYSERTNISDFSHDYVLWGIDGDFRFNVIKKGTEFATTDHCGAIKIVDEAISPEYLLYQLELQGHILGFDRTLRPSLTHMRKVMVKIPVDGAGNTDAMAQSLIVDKYRSLKAVKQELRSEINELSMVTFVVEPPDLTITMKIEDIFDLQQTTNRSWFTKEFVNNNKGSIPVYSASKDSYKAGYGFIKDNLAKVKYFEDILTWNIDGSVGKAFFRKGRFSLSEKVIPLILKRKWEGLIDYNYVKYCLEERALELGFAFGNKGGKRRIKGINIELPRNKINNSTLPDISKQKQLAAKYKQGYALRDGLIQYLQDLNDISVEL